MTSITKQAESLKTWPDKIYAHTRHWGKDDEAGRFMGCRNVDVEFPRPDNYVTVEYIRADLASPLPDDLIEQVLDSLNQCERYAKAAGAIHTLDKIESAIAILKGKK